MGYGVVHFWLFSGSNGGPWALPRAGWRGGHRADNEFGRPDQVGLVYNILVAFRMDDDANPRNLGAHLVHLGLVLGLRHLRREQAHARFSQQLAERSDVTLASDEAGQWRGEIMRRSRSIGVRQNDRAGGQIEQDRIDQFTAREAGERFDLIAGQVQGFSQ